MRLVRLYYTRKLRNGMEEILSFPSTVVVMIHVRTFVATL